MRMGAERCANDDRRRPPAGCGPDRAGAVGPRSGGRPGRPALRGISGTRGLGCAARGRAAVPPVPAGGRKTSVYASKTTRMERTRLGAVLAHVLRSVGASLPPWRHQGHALVIPVTEDVAGGGQVWARLYARAGGFPQIVHSAKRFAGPAGLEKHVGAGPSIALAVSVDEGAPVFRGAGYHLDLAGRRLRLPAALAPGRLTMWHEDRSGGAFVLALTLDHPLLGRLLRQAELYRDVPTCAGRCRSSTGTARSARRGWGWCCATSGPRPSPSAASPCARGRARASPPPTGWTRSTPRRCR